MQPRIPLTGSPRQTSYASATGLPPPLIQGQGDAPAPAAAPATSRVPKRAREDDDKSSSSSSSSSAEAGPLARRAQPLTTALTSGTSARHAPIGFNAFAYYASPRAAAGYRSSPAFARLPQPQPQPQPLAQRRPMPPDAVLATIAAFAAGKKPLAFFTGLRLSLGHRAEPSATAQTQLLNLRPEAILQWPAALRTPAAWHAYFQAGGTLAAIPERERSLPCCEAAIAHTPRALKEVPMALRTLGLCEEAVLQDGYAMESVPQALLAEDSEHRQVLCDLAYLSPRPPRLRDVPEDLLTEERCLHSLRWAPMDLGAVPEELLTTEVCVAAIQSCPPGTVSPFHAIPLRLRNGQVALAMSAHRFSPHYADLYPSDDWYLPGAITEEIAQAREAHHLRHDQENERLDRIQGAEWIQRQQLDGGQWGSAHGVPYASEAERNAARSLAAVPESERTLARWEAAVEADPWSYGYVPPEHRSWPLLLRALREAPELLVALDPATLLPDGVTEAMCLEAVQRQGLGPLLIPEEIRMRPSFQAAVRALPALPYNERAFRVTIDSEGNPPDPDPLTIEWFDRHLAVDPARARHIGWFLKPEWAVAAYRHGGRTPQSVCYDTPSADIVADFIAEIGPLTEAADVPDRDAKSSSSSGAAASATRPS